MWKSYSLRMRMCILLSALFVAALATGLVLLSAFSTEQIREENAPSAKSAVTVARALNAALHTAANPDATLASFVAGLATSPTDALKFRAIGETATTTATRHAEKVPAWFVRLMTVPDIEQHIPIMIGTRIAGHLIFEPDLSADFYEKWIGFLTILAAACALTLLAGAISYITIGTALKPLNHLADGLGRLSAGDFTQAIDCAGPPEIRQSCVSANVLAVTLARLNAENKSLLRRMLSLQDQERSEISRELHDELGPLLFAIRANVTAMIDEQSEARASPGQERALQAVETLQLANRRILDRLRPLYIQELGLDASIAKLLRDVRAQAPALDVELTFDPAIAKVDSVVAQTVYRVIQEGITNVLKHAHASQMRVKAAVDADLVRIEVADNGAGLASPPVPGRGLIGMRERLRALGGTFEFNRMDGWTTIRCSIPPAPDMDGS
jgi:two-component system sensor histidine kinase UhpB